MAGICVFWMVMAGETLEWLCGAWIIVALVVHVTMFFITAPFGRHTSTQWGPLMNNKWGWFVMELPSLGIMGYFLAATLNAPAHYSWMLFLLWILHYVNRTCIYPLRIKATPKKMPVAIVASAILFNIVNAGLNGYYLYALAPREKYDTEWLSAPHFQAGLILFLSGFFINIYSDNHLINLRKSGDTGYAIPRGFLFEFVSSPNLLGEIVEWMGFALMAWNLPAATFMVWTLANLIPRAKNHHDWYQKNFPDYPAKRKAVIPFLY